MNLTLRYTARNIKCNKLRVWMISLSVFIATLVFFFAFIFPTLVTTVKEDSMREFYGSSDIYIMPDLNSSIEFSLLGNIQMKNLYDDEEATAMFEYIVSFLALPGDISNDGAYILFGEVEDINKFNPIEFYQVSDVNPFGNNKVIISRAYAEEKQLTLESNVSIYVLGAKATFKVGAIAEDSGLFSGINKEIILASKTAVALGGPLYNFFGFIGTGVGAGAYFFDLALFKVKDSVSIETAISKLETIFPLLEINRTVDIDIIDETINSILPLFIIGVAIICLFCGFILYFISKMLVRDRATEFARLKCLGARNKHLLTSISLEILFYAVIGSLSALAVSVIVLLIATPNVLPAISFQYYIYPFLSGIALSFVGLILQINRFFISVKQSLVSSDKMPVAKKVLIALSIPLNIALFITIFLIPPGVRASTVIVYASLVLTTVYLTPFYFSFVCWVLNRIFRNKTFSSIYIRNSALTSHSPWLLRAISFGAITILLLSIMNSTFNTYMRDLNSTHDYNIKLAGITETNSSGFLPYFNTIEGVNKAYPGTVISGTTTDNKDINKITVYSYSDSDTEWLFSDYVEDSDVFQKISGEKQVLLGNFFRIVLGYKAGDKIIINFNRTAAGLNHEFTVAGFIDNAKMSKSIIADINEVNTITGVVGYNNLFILADESKINSIINEIKRNCLPSNPSIISLTTPKIMLDNIQRSSDKTISMLGTAFISITVLVITIVVTCVVTNFMCFLIFLKEIRKRYFIFNILGLSNRYLCNLLSLQLLSYSFAGVILSLFLIMPLKGQSENLLSLSGLTMTITPSAWQLILLSLLYCFVYVLFSWIFVPMISKKITLRDSATFKLNQEKLEVNKVGTPNITPEI